MRLLSKLFKICNKSTEKPDNKKFISSDIEQEDEITAAISSVLISMDEEEAMVAITAAIAVIL